MHTDPLKSYISVPQVLHWSIFLLLAVEFFISWTMPHAPRGAMPTAYINLHFSFGIVILGVILARAAWRLTHPLPALPQTLSPWKHIAAQTMHNLLYIALILMPLVGWVWAGSMGYPVSLFGLVPLPALVATGSAIGGAAKWAHIMLGILLTALILGYAVFAAYRTIRAHNVIWGWLQKAIWRA